MEHNDYPLRIEEILTAAETEWRTDDALPDARTEGWQMVYLRSGTVEERSDDQRLLLRPGALLLHQPGEVYAMTVAGEVPPEVFRAEFACTSAEMDVFRGRVFHADPAEQQEIDRAAQTARLVFEPPAAPGAPPLHRPDPPLAAEQELAICLERLLILLARRAARPRRPGVRQRRERRENALVEDARAYFAKNLAREVRVEDVCAALGCSRTQLQQAFRARLRRGPMEEFAAMRLDYAAQLLARGDTPGDVARRLGYCSGAYFSQRFKAATGNTPSEYRRIQQGLPARKRKR